MTQQLADVQLQTQTLSTIRLEKFSIPLSTYKDPPIELVLWEYGVNPSENYGDKIYNERSAELIGKQWAERGRQMGFDYNHDEFHPLLPGYQKISAGWGDVDASKERLQILNIEWTPRAKEAILNKEFRYLSGAFDLDENNVIVGLYNVGLTNFPATRKPKPLVSSLHGKTVRTARKMEKIKMVVSDLYDSLTVALAEAQEAVGDLDPSTSALGKEAAEALAPLITKMQGVLGTTESKENLRQLKTILRETAGVQSGFVGAVAALARKAHVAEELQQSEVTLLVKQGVDAHKIHPSEEKKFLSWSALDIRTYLERAMPLGIKTTPTMDADPPKKETQTESTPEVDRLLARM